MPSLFEKLALFTLCFPKNLSELNLKLFSSGVRNNFRLSSGKFGAKHRNQQTITSQVLAELNKIWSCLLFIKAVHAYVIKEDPLEERFPLPSFQNDAKFLTVRVILKPKT